MVVNFFSKNTSPKTRNLSTSHHDLKKVLQAHTLLESHEPGVIKILQQTLSNVGSSLEKLSDKSNTRIRFKFSPHDYKTAYELHDFLSKRGYCSPNELKVKTDKNFKYISFSTYALQSFNFFVSPKKNTLDSRSVKETSPEVCLKTLKEETKHISKNLKNKPKNSETLRSYLETYSESFKSQESLEEKTKNLKLYTSLQEHDKIIVCILVKIILDGACVSQRKSLNKTTRIHFTFPLNAAELAQKLHLILSRNGYCSTKPLKTKNSVYFVFDTYAFKSFNTLYDIFSGRRGNSATYGTRKSLCFEQINFIFEKILTTDLLNDPKFRTIVLKSYTKFLEHDQEIQSIFVGGLLGDCSLETKNVSIFVKFKYGVKNKEYALYLHETLSCFGYCDMKKPKIREFFDIRTKKTYQYLAFNTYSFKSFKELHSLFYRKPSVEECNLFLKHGKKAPRYIKVIPPNIKEFLTPQTLAHWIQDDGGYSSGLTLATHSFSKNEVLLLKEALQIKFNLTWTLRRYGESLSTGQTQYYLYLPNKQVPLLISIVKPYFVPTMYYKLGL